MGVREVRIYTCDGCGATATMNRDTLARGWHTLQLKDKRAVLCSVCYAAVEWVAKFQGLTMPPRVYRGPNGYRLRKSTPDQRTEAIAEEEDPDDLLEEYEED